MPGTSPRSRRRRARPISAIDRRAFSWTELFNELETALPHDVRVAGVIPHIDKTDQLIVVFEVERAASRRSASSSMALEESGAFRNLLSKAGTGDA